LAALAQTGVPEMGGAVFMAEVDSSGP
jgi:hypothetical protein